MLILKMLISVIFWVSSQRGETVKIVNFFSSYFQKYSKQSFFMETYHFVPVVAESKSFFK